MMLKIVYVCACACLLFVSPSRKDPKIIHLVYNVVLHMNII